MVSKKTAVEILAASAALAIAIAGTRRALQVHAEKKTVTFEYEKYLSALREYITAVMSDPARAKEAARVTQILREIGMPDLLSSGESSNLGLRSWQRMGLRIESIRRGRPSEPSLDLLNRFIARFALSNMPLAEICHEVAVAVGYTMEHETPPMNGQIILIEELDRRLEIAIAQSPPAIGEESLRVILDRMRESMTLVWLAKERGKEDPGGVLFSVPLEDGQSIGDYLRNRLSELRSGTLDPITSATFEARLLDLAGEAGTYNINH